MVNQDGVHKATYTLYLFREDKRIVIAFKFFGEELISSTKIINAPFYAAIDLRRRRLR